MDQERINILLAEVPIEIRNAVKPLDNDKAWAILIALLKEEEMRFSELKKTFNAQSPGDIDRYLKNLTAAGLIEKRPKYIKDMGSSEKTYYHPTELCKSLIRSLFDGLLIQPSTYKPRWIYTGAPLKNGNIEYKIKESVGGKSSLIAIKQLKR